MPNEVILFLSKGQVDYIQTILAKHNRKYDWALIKNIDHQTGGKYGKNWTW